MKAFAYVNATNEKEALAALAKAERGRVLPMAGGMDLLGLAKDYIVYPLLSGPSWKSMRHTPSG